MAAPRTISGVFKKLNLKDQSEIVILSAPASFEREIAQLEGVKVHRKLPARKAGFILAFVTAKAELPPLAKAIGKAAQGDAVVWFAYVKKSSTLYRGELGMEADWSALGEAGFEGVRMVAIDADWTAVRFRRAEFIKTMTRDPDFAMSKAGKAKTRKP